MLMNGPSYLAVNTEQLPSCDRIVTADGGDESRDWQLGSWAAGQAHGNLTGWLAG